MLSEPTSVINMCWAYLSLRHAVCICSQSTSLFVRYSASAVRLRSTEQLTSVSPSNQSWDAIGLVHQFLDVRVGWESLDMNPDHIDSCLSITTHSPHSPSHYSSANQNLWPNLTSSRHCACLMKIRTRTLLLTFHISSWRHSTQALPCGFGRRNNSCPVQVFDWCLHDSSNEKEWRWYREHPARRLGWWKNHWRETWIESVFLTPTSSMSSVSPEGIPRH